MELELFKYLGPSKGDRYYTTNEFYLCSITKSIFTHDSFNFSTLDNTGTYYAFHNVSKFWISLYFSKII
jgi:hypothetical protein